MRTATFSLLNRRHLKYVNTATHSTSTIINIMRNKYEPSSNSGCFESNIGLIKNKCEGICKKLVLRNYNKIENITNTVFRDVRPCSPAEIYEDLGATGNTFHLLSTISSTLKKETRPCSETFISSYQTTQFSINRAVKISDLTQAALSSRRERHVIGQNTVQNS